MTTLAPDTTVSYCIYCISDVGAWLHGTDPKAPGFSLSGWLPVSHLHAIIILWKMNHFWGKLTEVVGGYPHLHTWQIKQGLSRQRHGISRSPFLERNPKQVQSRWSHIVLDRTQEADESKEQKERERLQPKDTCNLCLHFKVGKHCTLKV